jgi:hypothetical protein
MPCAVVFAGRGKEGYVCGLIGKFDVIFVLPLFIDRIIAWNFADEKKRGWS